MHQVRVARPHHVTAPAAGPATAELSREEREQLRAVRHRAFQRHQRNAAWMRELLQHDGHVGGCAAPSEAPAQDQQSEAAEIQDMRKRLDEQQRELEGDQQRHSELLAALRAIDSDEALAACRARVMEETARHASATRKEPKVIRL